MKAISTAVLATWTTSIAMLASAAAMAAPPLSVSGEQWQPVGAARLDEMRGGFVAGSGLVVSFGIERVATVNGDLVASSRVNIPDVGRITADEAKALAALSQTRVVQVGAGTTVVPNGVGGLVIQNSLDGQSLAALTTVNVSVNTLGLFQDLNLNAALTNALVGASTSP